MKITELLNAQPTRAAAPGAPVPAPPRRLDMASLDLFARQSQRAPSTAAKAHAGADDDARPLVQRHVPYAHLVAPPRDAAMTPLSAPTISPVLSGNSSNDESAPIAQTTRRRRPAPKTRVHESDAVSALAALAQAAVASVKEEEEEFEQPVATRRRARPAGAVAATKKNKTTKKKSLAVGVEVPAAAATAVPVRTGPMTEDEKRAKQRMLVKKSYYRKIDTLKTLRETVGELEQEYNVVVETSKKNAVPPPPHMRHSIAALVNTSSSENELLQSFQEMAVDIDQLRRENEGLRAVAMEQSKARTRVGILVHEEFQDQHKRGLEYAEILDQIPATLRTPEEEADANRARRPSLQSNPDDHSQSPPRKNGSNRAAPVIHMTPVTEDECIDVVRDAYAELMRFRESNDYITSGGHVFGWRDRRRLDGDQVQFAFEKLFHNRTAEDLATNTWRVLSTERGINRVYSSSVRATYHFVQQVSEHNVVFYRTMEPVGQNVVIKSLILASLVQIETGYMVLFRSIDPSKRNVRDAAPPAALAADGISRPTPRKEIWADMFSWGVFESAGPNNEHCSDFFGGFVPATVAMSSSFWLMEVLLIAVRCESECVGSLFILPQEDDDHEHDCNETTKPDESGRHVEDMVMEL